MRFKGRILKSGGFWAIEVPILDISSQGMSKAEAYVMIADAIEALVNRRGFRVQVFPGPGPEFEIGASNEADLTAFLLKRARLRSRLSLAQVAARLGSRSPNSYARYEQGRAVPSIRKLSQLHAAVSGDRDLVLSESRFRPSADASPRTDSRQETERGQVLTLNISLQGKTRRDPVSTFDASRPNVKC